MFKKMLWHYGAFLFLLAIANGVHLPVLVAPLVPQKITDKYYSGLPLGWNAKLERFCPEALGRITGGVCGKANKLRRWQRFLCFLWCSAIDQ
jgi:hypothetical protein